VSCNRNKVVPSAGSVLHFDSLDKQVANHFLARKVALREKAACEYILREGLCKNIVVGEIKDATSAAALRVRIEAFATLAKAQAALAYACIAHLTVKSAKFQLILEGQKVLTQRMQQKFEEAWIGQRFPLVEARRALLTLKSRLRGFLDMSKAEIVCHPFLNETLPTLTTSQSNSSGGTPITSPRRNVNANQAQPQNVPPMSPSGIAFPRFFPPTSPRQLPIGLNDDSVPGSPGSLLHRLSFGDEPVLPEQGFNLRVGRDQDEDERDTAFGEFT